MDYEKKYKEALERAKRFMSIRGVSPEEDPFVVAKELCEEIFPELAESEDERMTREFNDWLCEEIECRTNDLRDEKDRRTLNMLCYVLKKVDAWLEKQKETEKEVSELFDCTDSYNKGYRAGQEKALQELKNHIKEDKTQCYAYDAGYASGFIVGKEQGWKERGKYEKQKENPKSADSIPSDCVSVAKCEDRCQKHSISVDELAQDYVDGVKEYNPEPTWDLIQTAVCYGYHYREQKEQKPAEWSEEDEMMIITIIQTLETLGGRGTTVMQIDWLKSLRPHWKPSEEQMEAFRSYIKDFQDRAEAAVGGWNNFDVMIRLYEQLKKL